MTNSNDTQTAARLILEDVIVEAGRICLKRDAISKEGLKAVLQRADVTLQAEKPPEATKLREFTAEDIHSDANARANGITDADWLKALQEWATVSPMDEDFWHQMKMKTGGDEIDVNVFLYNETEPPEVVRLTAYPFYGPEADGTYHTDCNTFLGQALVLL